MIEGAKPLGFAPFENGALQCALSELTWFMDVGCGFSPAHLNQKAGQNAQPTALNLYFLLRFILLNQTH